MTVSISNLRLLFTGCLVSWLLLSCDVAKEGPSSSEQIGTVSRKVIANQLHNGGTKGFVFLPPLVHPPADSGDFIPDLPVIVRVDGLNADGTTLRTLATFTKDSGPDGERLRIHYQNRPCDADDNDGDTDAVGYYYARWLTNDAALTPSSLYRVRVLVPAKGGQTRELGYVDVDVVTSAREYRSVDTQDVTPLLKDTTLRIKFRVDWPAVDQDHDGVYDWLDNCPSTANPDQVDGLNVGDACRCKHVTCSPLDFCHVAGACQPETGTCTNPTAKNGAPCVIAHASAACSGGVCQFEACHSRYADCNNDLTDGCETPITTVGNCDGCGISCFEVPNSRALCREGECRLACASGYADCDGIYFNGCEQNISTDPDNCGACGRACAAHEGCVRRACTTATCHDGYADCNHISADGCEVDVASDVNHCGGCNATCDLANATPSCAAGACAIATCNAGYADCDGIAANGCEVNLAENCGACNPCDDGNPCTRDLCFTGTGCVHMLDIGTCWMNYPNVSADGGCVQAACHALDATHSDCAYTLFADGTACRPMHALNRPNLCFNPGTCQAGVCVGSTPLVCPPPSGECYGAGVCSLETGACEYPPLSNNSCGLVDPCTNPGTCQFGFCHNNWSRSCRTLPDNCHSTVYKCIVEQACYGYEPYPNGTTCSNGNPCDGAETCQAGVCVAGTPPPDGTSCGDAGVCAKLVCE
jgi:hypothetical protein